MFTFFIVLLLVINNHQITANSLSHRPNYPAYSSIYNDLFYDDLDNNESPIVVYPNNFYGPDNDEIISQNPWSQLFHRHYERSILTPAYYSQPQNGFALRNGEVHYISYPSQKRAIPIELQKALFAHGIIGRR